MWQDIVSWFARRDLLRRIRKFGFTAMYVPIDDAGALSYSIGFWESVQAPEVVMFGAPLEIANGLIGEAHRQLKDGELTLQDGAIWNLEWEDGPRMAWRLVHPSQIRREYFNGAIWYREHRGFDRAGLAAYQLFTAGEGGKFPWEDGFDQSYRSVQPELYLPYLGPPETD